MAKRFRLHVATLYTTFQIGVNVLGFPLEWVHTRIISKSIKETELHLYQ